jgi:hypothetical protein
MRAISLLAFAIVSWAQAVKFKVLPQDLIEKRLQSYTTKNATRQQAIRTLFEEAGCKEDDLSNKA